MGSDRMLDDFRRWVQALEGLGASRIRFQTRGLQVSLLVVACLTAYLGRLIAAEDGGALGPVAALMYGVALMAAGAFLVSLRTGTLPPATVWTLHAFVLTAFVVGTVKNGAGPMILAPCAIVLSHALVVYRHALWFSVLLIASMSGGLWLHHQPDPVVTPRALVAMAATLFFMQLTSRYWAAWAGRATTVSRELQNAVEAIDERTRLSAAHIEEIMLIDAESGLPNARGFLQQARALCGAAGSPPQGLVIAIRMAGWADGCARHPAAVVGNLSGAMAGRLRECFGPAALIGRTSAEEFEVLILSPDDTGHADLLRQLPEQVQTLEAPCVAGKAVVVATPRVGLSLWPRDADDISDIVNKARLARDLAVRRALALPVAFDHKVAAQTAVDSELIHDLISSLREGDFELLWQPIMDSEGSTLRKAEALLRWNHPQRGLLLPESFIPLAEQSRLVFDLTEWVIGQAARQVKRWRDTLHPEFQVSINVPAAWLVRCAEQPQATVERLAALGVPPQAVVLEITEGSLLEVTPEVMKMMMMLKGLGLQIALDDFGVGYSSFGQLEKLDIDYLKLDKTFVKDLDLKPSRRAICEAVVTMAHHLGARVVAEGVERVEQLEWLEAIGVDWFQGYLLSHPMPASAVEEWARGRAHNASPPAALHRQLLAQPAWLQ